jgi:hypothetical protein
MNFLINTYYIFLRKYGIKGVEASIYGLTFPLAINCITLLTFFLFLFRTFVVEIDLSSYITTGLLTLGFGFGINRYLENRYLFGKNFNDLQLPKVFYFFAPLHYLISIFLFVISLRFS